jgi:hypothetical protein
MSEQHKEMSVARLVKEMADTQELFNFLGLINPFHGNPALCSLVTGVTADVVVNADRAKEVGNKILQNMIRKEVSKHSFKKKDQVVPLSNSNAITVKDYVINIDPQLLFQRLVIVETRSDNLTEVFRYSCSF